MRKIKVLKFEKYPAENPDGVYMVFELPCNDRVDFIDTMLPLAECVNPDTGETLTAEEIVNKAIANEKQRIVEKFEAMEAKPAIVGMEITLEETETQNE
jgi:hypothetical protein